MNDIIHLLWFMALWTLSLYMWCRWYRAEKETKKLDKGLQKDWERSDKLEEENFELKKDNERLKELNQACMEKIIKLKQ